MLVVNYDPKIGWCAPEIKPYGPLSFDPMSSCFQYCSNVFEGMKVNYLCSQCHFCLFCIYPQAYLGPNGEARLFRPQKNMERLKRSAERMALPVSSIITCQFNLLLTFDAAIQ